MLPRPAASPSGCDSLLHRPRFLALALPPALATTSGSVSEPTGRRFAPAGMPSDWNAESSRGLRLQRVFDSFDESGGASVGLHHRFDLHAIHAGRALFGSHPFPRRFQHVSPIDPVV